MAARVFVSYSHRDEELRDQLDWTISKELDQADIVLLLISPDFLASDYCYKIEKGRALERHREGTAQLVSVIMRPCDWKHTDLAEYLVTPTDGKPVTL